MERRGSHDAVARAPGKGCVRNPSYGHQGDTHRAGEKGSGCSIFGHSPIHLRKYLTAGVTDFRKQERGRTRKFWRAAGNSAGHGVLSEMMEGRVRNFLFPARPEDAPGTTAAAGKPGTVFLSVSPRRILRSSGISGNIRHTRSLLIRLPIHMPKKQTLPGSGQKGRPPWQAAVFRGGSWDILDFTVREGRAVYLQSGRTGGWENCRVFFLCRGTAPGRGGPPWQAAVRRRFRSWLLGWGVFHEEEGGVCPLSVSIKQ